MKNYVFAAIAAALITTGCNLLMGPNTPQGNGNLSISLGGGTGRSVVDSTEADTLTYTIEISGPGSPITATIPAGSARQYTTQVTPGTYTISVRAVGPVPAAYNVYNPGAFTTPMLRGIGKTTVTVGGGQTAQAEIHMRTAVEVSTWEQLSDAVYAAGNTGELILLTADIIISSGGGSLNSSGKQFTLAAASGTKVLNRGAYPGIFISGSSGTVTLGDDDFPDTTLILDGGNISTGTNPLINITGSTVVMKGNTVLQNNRRTSNDSGAAVSMSSGTFTMYGGSITGNTATGIGNGGAVFMSNGTFTMYEGSITGNTAYNGGAINITGGTFTMKNGSISNNTATNGGGAVYMNATSGIFTMEGGSISSNEQQDPYSNGGAIYMSFGTFHMNDGSITGNTSNSSVGGGGGVYLSNGTFNMNGGTISGNILDNPSAHGRGVYVGAAFTMKGGARVDGDVYLAGSTTYINLTGNLTSNPAANITRYAALTSGTQLLSGAAYIPANCHRFTVEGGTVDSVGQYVPL
jgi:hypothetical protein